MSAPLNDLPGGVPVYFGFPPSFRSASDAGDPIDLIDSDGECFAVQQIGFFEEGGNTLVGRIEQSADGASWAPVPGAAFAPVSAGTEVQVIRFLRTARFVRYAATAAGPNPDFAFAVLIGQPRKSF